MKAISLFSGGLDSQLAVRIIRDQGIEVLGINFSSPFFGADENTVLAADKLGIDLHTIDTGKEYIDRVLKNPVYGYGKNLNPCIDCHAFMFKKAGELMESVNASFLLSGDVVGQRPMSQNKSALNAVDKLSGYRGLIVRPLSARLLPISIPETEGWIDRSGLLDISGRGRTRQMELAAEWGIIDYPSPAGGCLLTEANFSRRLQKLLEYRTSFEPEEVEILKVGRHFLMGTYNLLIVGRNHSENQKMQELSLPGDYLLKVSNRPGPLGLLRELKSGETVDLEYAAAIVARYSDAKNEELATVKVFGADGEINNINIKPIQADKVPAPL